MYACILKYVCACVCVCVSQNESVKARERDLQILRLNEEVRTVPDSWEFRSVWRRYEREKVTTAIIFLYINKKSTLKKQRFQVKEHTRDNLVSSPQTTTLFNVARKVLLW